MKKTILIPLISVVVVASYYLYSFYTTRTLQVTFSDNKILASDRGGTYEQGVDGVSMTSNSNLFNLDLFESSRFVYVRFEDADWKAEDLRDMPPSLPSKAYRITLNIGVYEGSIFQANIGEYQRAYFYLTLFDPGTETMLDGMIRDLVPFGNATYHPEPPLVLHNEGRADIVRESEDTWIVDVDAWFTDFPSVSSFPRGPKYYVRLNFRMTISFKG